MHKKQYTSLLLILWTRQHCNAALKENCETLRTSERLRLTRKTRSKWSQRKHVTHFAILSWLLQGLHKITFSARTGWDVSKYEIIIPHFYKIIISFHILQRKFNTSTKTCFTKLVKTQSRIIDQFVGFTSLQKTRTKPVRGKSCRKIIHLETVVDSVGEK